MVLRLVYGLVDPTFTEAEAITRRFSPARSGQSSTGSTLCRGPMSTCGTGANHPHAVRKFIEPMVMAASWLA
jgi:hypothetical protein